MRAPHDCAVCGSRDHSAHFPNRGLKDVRAFPTGARMCPLCKEASWQEEGYESIYKCGQCGHRFVYHIHRPEDGHGRESA